MQHKDNTEQKGGPLPAFWRYIWSQRAGDEDNQRGVPGDQSRVPQTAMPPVTMFGPGSQNNIGGGQFNNQQGDRTDVTIHIHKSGVVKTSVDQFPGTSKEIDQTNLADPMPLDTEPTPHNAISTQGRQRSNKFYELCLMQKGRGYPLWIPQANVRSPKPYRANGVSIGDVGLITPYGGFDFLFNICLPHDDPINPNQLPMNFTPIPLHPSEIREFPEFSSGSYLASSFIAMSQTESQTSEMVFESSVSEGAILTMPGGAYQEELRNVAKFREYISTHAEDWYRYVNLILGCEAQNGDLHLVVGSDKSTSWGMATFMNASRQKKFHLKFQPLGTDNRPSSRTTSVWEHSGMADVNVRSGPDASEIHELGATPDNPLRNQCLFLRTLGISLSPTAWEKTTQKSVKVPGNDPGKYNVHGSEIISSSNVDQQGESSTGSSNQYSINGAHEGQSRDRNVLLVDPFPSPATPHPSKVINDFLLKQQPTAVVAVTDDRDWQHIEALELGFPATLGFLDRISLLNDACMSNGAAYLQLKAPNILDKHHEKEKIVHLKEGFKSNQDKMTVNRYLFGDGEIYRQILLAFCETLESTTFRPYQDHLEEISQQIHPSLIDCHFRILPLDDLLSLLRDSGSLDVDTSRESALSSHHRLFTNHPTDDSMSIQKTRMQTAYGFSQRYHRLKRKDDLEEAIALLQDVLVDAPIDHYLHLDALLALAPLLHQRYLIKGLSQDLLSLVQNLEIQAKLNFEALLHPFEQELARLRLEGADRPIQWFPSVKLVGRKLGAVSFPLRLLNRLTELFPRFSPMRSVREALCQRKALRRALLIGVGSGPPSVPVENTPEMTGGNNYQEVARGMDKQNVLTGPRKDTWDLSRLLIDVYGYDAKEVTVLIDDNIPGHIQPTKDNIIQSMKDLVRDAAKGDQFFFHFAGHCIQMANTHPTEEDCQDEFIVTSAGGLVIGDDLHEYLVSPLPAGSSLVAVLDSCDSGTLLDLPHTHCNRVYVPWVGKVVGSLPSRISPSSYRPVIGSGVDAIFSEQDQARYFHPPQYCTGWCREEPLLMVQSPVEADVISLSAAKDGQKSWEDEEGPSMTQVLIRILHKNPEPSLENLLMLVSHELHKSHLELHDKFRAYIDEVRISNQKRRQMGRAPRRVLEMEMGDFRYPQISSLEPLDMKRPWKI